MSANNRVVYASLAASVVIIFANVQKYFDNKQNKRERSQIWSIIKPTAAKKMREMSPRAWELSEQFKPRPSDIVILTAPKTGTTWFSQIFHQLRTGGDMNYSGITEIVPWIGFAYDCDQV